MTGRDEGASGNYFLWCWLLFIANPFFPQCFGVFRTLVTSNIAG